MEQRVQALALPHVPNTDGGIAAAGDDDVLVILETQHGAHVSDENLCAFQGLQIPHLDRVVSKTAYNLGIIVLQAVNAFTRFGATVDAIEIVLACLPVVFDTL